MICMCIYSTDGWSQVSKSPQLGTWTGHLHQLHRASSPQPPKSRQSLMVRWVIIFVNRSRERWGRDEEEVKEERMKGEGEAREEDRRGGEQKKGGKMGGQTAKGLFWIVFTEKEM